MIRKIAFIGATGMLGKPVASELTKAGFDVTALVRHPDKAKKTLPDKIALVTGDVSNPMTLESLLSGQDALYVNLNLHRSEKKTDFHAETDGMKNIMSVAKRTGIKQIGFISSLVMRYQGMNDFNWWVFDMKKEAVDLVRSSGIPYTIFYPSTFMDNFEYTYRRGSRLLLAGASLHKMYFIAAEDYGRQVAGAFRNPASINKEYVVQGLEGFTADEAAEEYRSHYTKQKLSIARAPLGLIKFLGLFNQSMNYGANIVEALNKYPEKFEAAQTWEDLGKPTITLREFAARR